MRIEFIGIFPPVGAGKFSYAYRAIRDLFESAPSFRRVALPAMKIGGERDHVDVPFVGRPVGGGDTAVFERRVDNISFHGATVALAANSLADFIGLEPQGQARNLLVTAAGLHDASKVLELEVMGCRDIFQKPNVTIKEINEAKKILKNSLVRAGVIVKEDEDRFTAIVSGITQCTALDLPGYFDRTINLPFIQHAIVRSGEFVEKTQHDALITIATADSVDQLPALFARVNRLKGKYQIPNDDATGKFQTIIDHLQERGELPSLSETEETSLLATALLFCDVISQGDKLRTVDERIDAAIKGGQYDELDKQAQERYGESFFEANRVVSHMSERVLTLLGVQNGYVAANEEQTELPRKIFENILRRADARVI